MNALKQRVQAVLNDESLDDQSRTILRHALEQNDPCIAELVRPEDAREIIDTDEDDLSRANQIRVHPRKSAAKKKRKQ